eukprot:g847.t1
MYSTAVDALNSTEEQEEEAEFLLSCAVKTLREIGSPPAVKSVGTQRGTKRRRADGGLSPQGKLLLSESLVLLGRLVEWKSPAQARESYRAALSVSPESAEAHLQLGRLAWKTASSQEELDAVEKSLRTSIDLVGDDEESDDTAFEAQRLLVRLFCQSTGKHEEAHELLADMGYSHVLSSKLTATTFSPTPPELSSTTSSLSASKLAAIHDAPHAVNVFDRALTPTLLNLMQQALKPDAQFWKENKYDSPRTGFFSFQHSLPPFSSASAGGGSSSSGGGGGGGGQLGLDTVLQHIWRVAAEAVPRVKAARFVEWWAHSRPHSNGHKLHFDYVSDGSDRPPRHPIISTVTFLTAGVGGPTLITDQRACEDEERKGLVKANEKGEGRGEEDKGTAQVAKATVSTKGWLVAPAANRLVCFDGSLLHCVLPGAGPAPRVDPDPGARRLTFMAAFWEEDPHAPPLPGVEDGGGSGQGKSEGGKGGDTACGSCTWPASFTMIEQVEDSRRHQHNAAAVVPLGGDELWERVVGGEEKTGDDEDNEDEDKNALDLLREDVFTHFAALNSGLLTARQGESSANNADDAA